MQMFFLGKAASRLVFSLGFLCLGFIKSADRRAFKKKKTKKKKTEKKKLKLKKKKKKSSRFSVCVCVIIFFFLSLFSTITKKATEK
jgi:hypothetical protein